MCELRLIKDRVHAYCIAVMVSRACMTFVAMETLATLAHWLKQERETDRGDN